MTAGEMKEEALDAFKRNFWPCVIVSFISVIVGQIPVISISFPFGSWDMFDMSNSEGLGGAMSEFMQFDFFKTILTAFILYGFVILIGFSLVILILSVFVFGPVRIGCCRFFKDNLEDNASIDGIFKDFKLNYGNRAKAILIVNSACFLVSLINLPLFIGWLYFKAFALFIIVVSLAAFYLRIRFVMLPYVFADNPDIDWKNALKMSAAIMKGEVYNFIWFTITFAGWAILGLFTLGLGYILWLYPYYKSSVARFYLEVSSGYISDDSGFSDLTIE